MMSDEELEILEDVNMLTLEEIEYMENKKTKTLKVDFDLIPIEELKKNTLLNLADAKEATKSLRTSKSKRQNKAVIQFFGSVCFYLEQIPSTD
jgi:hypothetical protein